ncbi:ABC transporter ATP-binding protein [Eremococcus coleocola]|uniref:ABC transporter, ATP-binding protein n=1 Tax=Eremococcus coleocola ACS-139-V-Col8 TaxID=908337 RepID=E4KN03_9LACT|nr:ABC transporter ATP-binding protein [Eremococcus coleocola]EFR31719.1 ABC transporter, ATP-binding protein [Eremococcus coleocola ACS-139-V-Col8]
MANQAHRHKKANDVTGSILRIVKEIIAYKWGLILVLFSTIMATLLTIFGPVQLGKATTLIFEGVQAMIQGHGSIDQAAVGRVLLTVLILYIVSGIFNAVQGYAMITITETVTYNLRKRMLAKINRLPMSYFESQNIGEILSRIVNDVDTLGMTMSQSAAQLLNSLMTLIGIGIIMFTINTTMALVVLVIVPVSVVIVRIILKLSQRYFRGMQRTLGKVSGQVEEVYAGQRVVTAFNQETAMKDSFDIKNDALRDQTMRAMFVSGVMFPIMRFISSLGYVAVVIVGAYLTIQGRMAVGNIQAFTQYVNRFTQPITQLAQIFNLMQSMAAASERVFEFLDENEENQEIGAGIDVAQIEGQVDFDHVKFGYQPDQIIVHDFSTQIQPGQKVALVGPTGAGKSTIVKLLMRFYDVNAGAILLDKSPTTNFSRMSYQQAMAMVLQDTWLFKGSLMENIRYGRLDASDEEVIAAAKAARVHRFIKSLPGGYQFELNENTDNISQGQKQLLTIARAILANRPVLILDEATSSVDTRTEVLIQQAMDHLMEGRTSFVIAHRLSTIRDADRILYMEHGDIVEQGNHDELMALQGRYADLYNSQFASA